MSYGPQYNPRHIRAYYSPQQQQQRQLEYIQDDYPQIMTQSSSVGTSRYYQEQQQPQEYCDYVPTTITTRKRRNKIDRTVHLHLDGEPMNDLEVIAAKNAAKNERKSKIVYPDELSFQENHDSVSPLNTMMESLSVSSLASTLVDTDSTASDNNFKDEEQQQQQQQQQQKDQVATKKKAWPFVSLFKKKPDLSTTVAAAAVTTNTAAVTTTTTSPPTPVLSPDCNSTSSSPFEELDGIWAFSYPTMIPMTPTVWVRFDNENQKLISDHVRSTLPVVQFFDSHIGRFTVLVTVIPAQRACFVPIANQLSRLNLNYIPSHLAHQ
ncbi:hypothetical protein HPULCUR_007261 [Helicostylum pulchrum]|uniref:Uncharacterized protein n=1 Tax=Helicostylum pulchrum TaxID=562976 RepID=A0ABP9Y4C5_9FUNG